MGVSIPKLIKRQSSGGSCQFALKESLKEETVIEGKSTMFMASFNLVTPKLLQKKINLKKNFTIFVNVISPPPRKYLDVPNRKKFF